MREAISDKIEGSRRYEGGGKGKGESQSEGRKAEEEGGGSAARTLYHHIHASLQYQIIIRMRR